MRVNSSSKTSQSRLVKMSGRMKSLNFGASCAPRMLHAASQIQDSRDLSLFLVIIFAFLGGSDTRQPPIYPAAAVSATENRIGTAVAQRSRPADWTYRREQIPAHP